MANLTPVKKGVFFFCEMALSSFWAEEPFIKGAKR